ncbi:hypothetical protein RUND412_005925 [Rhizina undulata]
MLLIRSSEMSLNGTETFNFHGLKGRSVIVPDKAPLMIVTTSLFPRTFRRDDWLISVATVKVTYGTGKHYSDVPDRYLDPMGPIQLNNASRILYIIAVGLTKISVLAFLAHLNPYNSIRLCIKALIIAISAFVVIGSLLIMLQCIPMSAVLIVANFDGNSKQTSKCMNLNVLAFAVPGVNTLLDFLVWTLPVKIIWHVRATLRQKLAMVMWMCLGLTACIASLMRIYALAELRFHDDPTWYLVDVNIWITAEISIAIICTCCPALKQLFQHHFIKPVPTPEIQPPSEDSLYLDQIPFHKPSPVYGNSRNTSQKESMDDFMYDPYASQSWKGSTRSSQLMPPLPELASFIDRSRSITSDAVNK